MLETMEKKESKKEKERNQEYGYFLLNWEYGSIKNVATMVGVSERMIRFYVEQYWVYKTSPKFERKKGAYGRFISLIKSAEKNFERRIKNLAKEEDLDGEKLIEIFKKAIKKAIV